MSSLGFRPISVSDYLAQYQADKPSVEFEDGVLFLKPMGTTPHSRMQFDLCVLLRAKGLDALPEVRCRVSAQRYLVPDVIASQGQIVESCPTLPVYLCAEIVSPDQERGRLATLFGKCERYHEWGVTYCWVIDPTK